LGNFVTNKRAIWPNLVTIGNLFCGFLSIVLVTREKFVAAAWIIVVAAIFDGLDGAVARLVKTSSRFGAEIDSLADVVSFGVAPALLVYHVVLDGLGEWGVILAFLPVAGGALRLARYNIITANQPHSKKFMGMPIPGSALILTSFFLYAHVDLEGRNALPIWFSLIPIVSLLMISPITYSRMPIITFHGSLRSKIGSIALIVVTGLMIWDPPRTFFPLMMVYLFSGPVEWMLEHLGILHGAAKRSSLDESTIVVVKKPKRPRRQR
jgi:CDP-diacylglycerol--serine O-phosphatidyltransferase